MILKDYIKMMNAIETAFYNPNKDYLMKGVMSDKTLHLYQKGNGIIFGQCQNFFFVVTKDTNGDFNVRQLNINDKTELDNYNRNKFDKDTVGIPIFIGYETL